MKIQNSVEEHKCEKAFTHMQSLSKHLETHVKLYVCNICESSFGFKQNLDQHSKIHSEANLNKSKVVLDCDMVTNFEATKDSLKDGMTEDLFYLKEG